MRITLFVLTTLLCLSGYSQRDYTYGTVKDSSSSEWMIGVHIKNLQAGLLTSTSPNGTFKIPAQQGDTLEITYVGYETIIHVIKEENVSKLLQFVLIQEAIMLSEVEVNVFPEYVRFKEMIIAAEPEEEFKIALPQVVAAYKPKTAQQMQNPDLRPNFGMAFSLDGLTKKGKERKKLNSILENKSVQNVAYRKFNRNWVAEETRLSGDELTDFIEYCDFSTKYLAKTTLFEIRRKMMTLLAEFRSDNVDNYSPGA